MIPKYTIGNYIKCKCHVKCSAKGVIYAIDIPNEKYKIKLNNGMLDTIKFHSAQLDNHFPEELFTL